ncbi:MAG: hypothetical protein GX126_07485 [Bacteroidales bacterium]|nr:hypothetical protein [Bacteroidales bacterium]
MNYPLGNQYSKDDNFKAKARLHQSHFRSEILQVDFDEYGNRLTRADALNYLNFYPGLGVVETLKNRYPKYSKGLYADMLRSEHIPFNMFAPLKQDLKLAKKVFKQLLKLEIKEITKIKIEYAPSPAAEYLNDKTSFDTYMEFITDIGEMGFLGIEVKYTEHEYKLKPNSKEANDIDNLDSPYEKISYRPGLFVPDSMKKLKSDRLRQIWRNHLLGESMLLHSETKFKHFISLIFYPSGNKHFNEVIPEYKSLLTSKNQNKLMGITYESYFDTLSQFTLSNDFTDWLKYLKSRYVIK